MNLEYLNTLKQKGNFTYEQVAKMSGVPEATVKNIFTGKTEDPRFDTLAAVVHAMGGNLDTYYKKTPSGREADANLLVAVKELYEARIIDYKERIFDFKETVAGLRKDRHHLWTAICILGVLFVLTSIADIMIGSIGWFRY